MSYTLTLEEVARLQQTRRNMERADEVGHHQAMMEGLVAPGGLHEICQKHRGAVSVGVYVVSGMVGLGLRRYCKKRGGLLRHLGKCAIGVVASGAFGYLVDRYTR